jgi:DNA-directed RNA polymerase beta subunit
MSRGEADKTSKGLTNQKKQAVELEAHCDYLSAWEEDKYIIAQANVGLDDKGKITAELVNARPGRQLRAEARGRNRVHGRESEAARLGRGQPDSVP